MKKIALFVFIICLNLQGFSQNRKKDQEFDIVNHRVELGETVRMVSKKYLVDPSEIYKLNKFAVDGISQGMILKVPVPRKEEVVVVQETDFSNSSEEVAQLTNERVRVEKPKSVPGKPLISKQQQPEAKVAEVKSESAVTVIDRGNEISHTVVAQETLYSLSRKYNVSVDEIKLSNKNILTNGLQVGQVLKIPSTRVLKAEESSLGSDVTPTAEVTKTTGTVSTGTVKHVVAPKETLFGLSKMYNVSVEEIKRQNATTLQNGLQIGQVLTIAKNN